MIKITTEDNIDFTIKKDIKNMSELFNVLIVDYDMNKSNEIMNTINSKDLKLLIDFCEICNYEPICLKKPFCIGSVEYYTNSFNERLMKFYNELTMEIIILYANLSDYYIVSSIDELIYLKLYEVHTSNNKQLKTFLKLKDEDDIKIPIDTERILREKYRYYCKIGIKEMTDEEVNILCEKYY